MRGAGTGCPWTGGRRDAPSTWPCWQARGLTGERVTSVDVARRVGVSQSTVSLVFSGKAAGRISARTEAAVRAAAAELGYRPNAAARALKMGAARTIVLVVPDITNPFFGGLLRGAQTAARAAGLRGRADRHRQRPRLGRRLGRGAARRSRRRAAAVRGRPAAPRGGLGADRRDRVRGPRPPVGAARRRGRHRGGHPPPARARPPPDRPRRVGARPADVQGAPPHRRPPASAGEVPRVRTDFTLDAARAAHARAADAPTRS